MGNQLFKEFNQKFVYIGTNPENIISANKGALFFRENTKFFLNSSGKTQSEWIKLPYKTVVSPPPPKNMPIKYKHPTELWIKTTNGYLDVFGNLQPKTGWKFLSHKNVFFNLSSTKNFTWFFPPPIASDDPTGVNNNRSYDNNYFYVKLSGIWYRTPITVYSLAEEAGPDNPSLSSNLPFIDLPRSLPVPASTGFPGILGDQSYDIDFFYLDPSQWRRCMLLIFYNPNKMAMF